MIPVLPDRHLFLLREEERLPAVSVRIGQFALLEIRDLTDRGLGLRVVAPAVVRDIIARRVAAVEVRFHVAHRHDGILLRWATAPERIAGGPVHEAQTARGLRGAGREGVDVFAVGVKVNAAGGPIETVFVVGVARVEGEDVDFEVGFAGAVVYDEIELVRVRADLGGEEFHVDLGSILLIL